MASLGQSRPMRIRLICLGVLVCAAALAQPGGAAYTRDAKVALKMDFSDDVAGPFPANFVCFQYGGGPTGLCDSASGFVYGYNAACSVPASGGKSTRFD